MKSGELCSSCRYLVWDQSSHKVWYLGRKITKDEHIGCLCADWQRTFGVLVCLLDKRGEKPWTKCLFKTRTSRANCLEKSRMCFWFGLVRPDLEHLFAGTKPIDWLSSESQGIPKCDRNWSRCQTSLSSMCDWWFGLARRPTPIPNPQPQCQGFHNSQQISFIVCSLFLKKWTCNTKVSVNADTITWWSEKNTERGGPISTVAGLRSKLPSVLFQK